MAEECERPVALELQIWNEIESSHFAFPLHTQPGCYITVPSCSARVTLKEHTPKAISHVRLALGNVHCDVPLTKIMFALCSNIMFISCLYCPKVYILLRECASQCQTNVYLTNKCIFNQETEQSILNSLYIDLTWLTWFNRRLTKARGRRIRKVRSASSGVLRLPCALVAQHRLSTVPFTSVCTIIRNRIKTKRTSFSL